MKRSITIVTACSGPVKTYILTQLIFVTYLSLHIPINRPSKYMRDSIMKTTWPETVLQKKQISTRKNKSNCRICIKWSHSSARSHPSTILPSTLSSSLNLIWLSPIHTISNSFKEFSKLAIPSYADHKSMSLKTRHRYYIKFRHFQFKFN